MRSVMNSIGVAGATWISQTTNPPSTDAGGLFDSSHTTRNPWLGPLALERAGAVRLHEHGGDGAHQRQPHVWSVVLEHQRLGGAPDGAHQSMQQSTVRQVAGFPVRPPDRTACGRPTPAAPAGLAPQNVRAALGEQSLLEIVEVIRHVDGAVERRIRRAVMCAAFAIEPAHDASHVAHRRRSGAAARSRRQADRPRRRAGDRSRACARRDRRRSGAARRSSRATSSVRRTCGGGLASTCRSSRCSAPMTAAASTASRSAGSAFIESMSGNASSAASGSASISSTADWYSARPGGCSSPPPRRSVSQVKLSGPRCGAATAVAAGIGTQPDRGPIARPHPRRASAGDSPLSTSAAPLARTHDQVDLGRAARAEAAIRQQHFESVRPQPWTAGLDAIPRRREASARGCARQPRMRHRIELADGPVASMRPPRPRRCARRRRCHLRSRSSRAMRRPWSRVR